MLLYVINIAENLSKISKMTKAEVVFTDTEVLINLENKVIAISCWKEVKSTKFS